MGNNHCDMLYLCIGNRKSDGNSRYSESNNSINNLNKKQKNYGIGIEFD